MWVNARLCGSLGRERATWLANASASSTRAFGRLKPVIAFTWGASISRSKLM